MDTIANRRQADALPSDAELLPLIRAEQIRMLFANATSTGLVAGVIALTVAWMVRHDVPTDRVLWWVLLKFIVLAVRLFQVQRFSASAFPENPKWYQGFVALVVLDGFIWGLAAVWLHPVHSDVAAFTAAFLLCLAAGGAFVLHADLAASAGFIVPIVAPAAYALVSRGDEFGWLAGLGSLGYLAVLLTEARRSERRMVELLWLRYTTDRIAQERAQALTLAEQHSAFKSQFLATMSHEMRTPLHGILGLARQVRLAEPLPESRRKLELVERSGEHLLTVINDVLDVSKIEAGRIQIDRHAFDLAQVLVDAAELTAVQATGKGLVVETEIKLPRPCWVEGDSARVSQVLHNLLGNAVKFTDQGRVSLRAWRNNNTEWVSFSVEDSGIGIAPEEVGRIFDAFHQADRSYNRRYAGAGLGLAISRELSRAMGGDIVCASMVGQGSAFTFTVPLPICAPADADTEPATETASAAAATEAVGGLHGRVLMAEDNPVNAMVAQAVLSRLGLEVEIVDDGMAAVERLRRGERPDLVLMDCQMPVMDGFEATRLIRADEARLGQARVPIVALTANAMEADRQRCLDAGMDAHLPKPFRDEQLVELLRELLPSRTMAAAGVTA